MTDLVWLNTFRIQSSRYCREKPCVALVCYIPIDNSLIAEIQGGLRDIAEKASPEKRIRIYYAFDGGKRCVWDMITFSIITIRMKFRGFNRRTCEAGALLDEYSMKTGTIRQVRYVVNQGCCRKENLLYI